MISANGVRPKVWNNNYVILLGNFVRNMTFELQIALPSYNAQQVNQLGSELHGAKLAGKY